jgi:hypothetical protein
VTHRYKRLRDGCKHFAGPSCDAAAHTEPEHSRDLTRQEMKYNNDNTESASSSLFFFGGGASAEAEITSIEAMHHSKNVTSVVFEGDKKQRQHNEAEREQEEKERK